MGWTAKFVVGVGISCCLVLGAIAAELRPGGQAYVRPSFTPFPPENPYSEAKVDLGRRMFFDPIFSASQTISCATCHIPAEGWTDRLSHARGEGDHAMTLRTPTLVNVAWLDRLGWDGKFDTLEAVAFAPITGSLNMNLPERALLDRLSAASDYPPLFEDAFGDAAITRERIELALATYERTIVSAEAPFDRWMSGTENAIGDSAKRGFDLFNGKAQCARCHSGWAFTDGSFHDIGTATGDDIGRGRLFPTSVKLRYAFKTPSLRDVALRTPFMHDGALTTLQDVIDLYDRGGIDRPSRAEVIRPLHLTPSEKADLLAFLQTLTGDQPRVAAAGPAH